MPMKDKKTEHTTPETTYTPNANSEIAMVLRCAARPSAGHRKETDNV